MRLVTPSGSRVGRTGVRPATAGLGSGPIRAAGLLRALWCERGPL